MIPFLWRTVRPFPVALALLIVLQIAPVAASLLPPDLNARIIDRGVMAGSGGHVPGLALAMLGLAVGGVCAGTWVALAAARHLRVSVLKRVQELSCREFAGFGAPSLPARTTNDVHQVRWVLTMALAYVATAPATWIGGVAMAVRHDAQLSVIVLAVAAVLGSLTTVTIRRMRPHSQALRRGVDAVNRVVRAFAKDAQEQDYSASRMLSSPTPASQSTSPGSPCCGSAPTGSPMGRSGWVSWPC